jgi:hypothetical protein
MIVKQLCQIAQGTAMFPTTNGDPTTEVLQHKQVYFYSENVPLAAMVGAKYFEAVADESVGGNGTLNEGDIVFLFANNGFRLATVTDAVNGTVTIATTLLAAAP